MDVISCTHKYATVVHVVNNFVTSFTRSYVFNDFYDPAIKYSDYLWGILLPAPSGLYLCLCWLVGWMVCQWTYCKSY